MAEVLARVAALGGSAAERGGGYCALCFATAAERRLVAPRRLQRLVQLLVGYMQHLAPVASALTWGARACAWCEARCAAAARALRALAAAAGAHALLAQLDTGQADGAAGAARLAEAGAALAAARGAALRCTDVLLIDTRQPAAEPRMSAAPGSAPTTASDPEVIETVVIEDDPVDPLALCDPPARARGPPAAVRVTAGKASSAGAATSPCSTAVTPKTVPVAASRVIQGVANNVTATLGRTVEAQTTSSAMGALGNVAQNASPTGAGATMTAPMLMSALSGAGAGVTAGVTPGVAAGVTPGVALAAAAGVTPGVAPSVAPGDAVLMMIPPGAQIVSRLDGVGPKYLLLNPPPAPPAPAAAPAPPGTAAPPGRCTVSCDSDSDGEDSQLLGELIRRRDEYARAHAPDGGAGAGGGILFDMGDSNCYITDVKSLSEEKNSAANADKQWNIKDVKSLSENSVKNNNNKRSSVAARASKKARGGPEREEARAPALSTDRVDWEDKIPMDVISFVDATDPRAASFLPPLTDTPNNSKTRSKNCKLVSNSTQSAQTALPSAQTVPASAQEAAMAGPRPLALICNVQSANGEQAVVIDLC